MAVIENCSFIRSLRFVKYSDGTDVLYKFLVKDGGTFPKLREIQFGYIEREHNQKYQDIMLRGPDNLLEITTQEEDEFQDESIDFGPLIAKQTVLKKLAVDASFVPENMRKVHYESIQNLNLWFLFTEVSPYPIVMRFPNLTHLRIKANITNVHKLVGMVKVKSLMWND